MSESATADAVEGHKHLKPDVNESGNPAGSDASERLLREVSPTSNDARAAVITPERQNQAGAVNDGALVFQNGSWTHERTDGKVVALSAGLQFETSERQPEVRPAATSAIRMDPETLSAAAVSLRDHLGDRRVVEATLRSIPAADKEQFEQVYRQSTGVDLREELRRRGMDSSIALLDPREEVRNAAWLKRNLDQLGHLSAGSTERTLVEHNLRLSLRSMSAEERQALSAELRQSTGRDLQQTLAESAMSEPSRRISAIYAQQGSDVSAEQLRQIAEIGLSGERLPNDQRMMIVKEAFSGNSAAAQQARQEFLGPNSEGENRLRQVFGDNMDFRQAMDYARYGRLDTSTFVDLQSSRWGNNDRGVELALRMMTDNQRRDFDTGQRLAVEGRTEGATPAETEALQYYQRVHDSLARASESDTSLSRVFSQSTRDLLVTGWEDMAAHGERTLIGRLAGAQSRMDAIDAVRNFTPRDQQLMQDPTYARQVWDMLGGQPGADDLSVYSRTRLHGILTEAAREQLQRIFPPEGVPADVSVAARRPTLEDVTQNGIRPDSREPYQPISSDRVFEALMTGRPEEYAALTQEQRRMLQARIYLVPDGARDAAQNMLNRLQAGQDVETGQADQVYLAALRRTSKQDIAAMIVQQSPEARQDSRMEQAARFAFGADFDKIGRGVLEGRGISAENLLALNTDRGWVYNTIDQANYYRGLRLIPQDERERILASGEIPGLSADQRAVALNVLRNPNQELTLADQIRARSLGATFDQQQTIDAFAKLSPAERLDQINQYAVRYQRFLPDDMASRADEHQKRQIELALPMSRGDLNRAFRDSVRESGVGLYGNTAVTEISMEQMQTSIQSQLIDRLPAEERQRVQQEIDTAFQRYVGALRENNQARDEYARDLSDKIMMAATLAVAPLRVGTTLARIALTTATAVAARAGSEHLIQGELSSSDMVHAAILGTVDGASLGRASALKGIFARSVEGRFGGEVGKNLAESMAPQFERLLNREIPEQQFRQELEQALRRQGINQPEVAARDIMGQYRMQERLDDVFRNIPGSQTTVTDFSAATRRLDELAARGTVTPEQVMELRKGMTSRFGELVRATPEQRQQILDGMRIYTDTLKAIERAGNNPEHARALTDVMLMAMRNPEAGVPLRALQNADARVVAFYRDQMTDVLQRPAPLDAVVKGGQRYEHAMNPEVVRAFANPRNEALRDWIYIPGVPGSTADHAGLDGLLINVRDGRLMPIDLKASKNLTGTGQRFHVHIEARNGQTQFGRDNYYDARGRFVPAVRPSQDAIEQAFTRVINNEPSWTLPQSAFQQFNPESRLRLPNLGNRPTSPNDVATLQAQADEMRAFMRDRGSVPNGNGNVTLVNDQFKRKIKYVEDELAKARAAENAAAAGRVEAQRREQIAQIQRFDSALTAADARGVIETREWLAANHVTLSERDAITTYRAFNRLNMSPTAEDAARLVAAAGNPNEIQRIARDRLASNLSEVIGQLGREGTPEERTLAQWATDWFRNPETGAIDNSILREIAADSAEKEQLRALLHRLYSRLPARDRAIAVTCALDRLAIY